MFNRRLLGSRLFFLNLQTDKTMNRFKIETADIILENYETGKGKIIISDLNHGSFSFYWGAMGESIEAFLKGINSSYFADKLCNNRYEFSAKQTAKEIRKYIREEMKYDLPWYKFQSAQKELREKIKEIERSENQYEALSLIQALPDNLMCLELSHKEEREFNRIVRDMVSTEPWNFLQNDYSQEYRYLEELHKRIRLFLNAA